MLLVVKSCKEKIYSHLRKECFVTINQFRMIDTMVKDIIRVYVLYSDPPLASIDDLTSDDFRSLLDLNVIGYFRASKVR